MSVPGCQVWSVRTAPCGLGAEYRTPQSSFSNTLCVLLAPTAVSRVFCVTSAFVTQLFDLLATPLCDVVLIRVPLLKTPCLSVCLIV
jgi:hypothetical protein